MKLVLGLLELVWAIVLSMLFCIAIVAVSTNPALLILCVIAFFAYASTL